MATAVLGQLQAIVDAERAGGTGVARPSGSADELCELAEAHGVLPLLAAGLDDDDRRLNRETMDALRRRASEAAAADLVREAELRRLVAALAAAGVPPLLMKGAHLAYACYARPDLRPRVDTDLLIEPAERARAHAVFTALGYARVPQLAADLVMYQEPYALRRGPEVAHLVDVHWRVSNAQRFGTALTCTDLRREAEPLPALGPAAIGLGRVHALLLACVHRVAHHRDAPRLIWSYDIHLIASGFQPLEWHRMVTLAIERRVAAACARGLAVAAEGFGTDVPAAVSGRLAAAAAAEGGLPAYASPGRRHIARVWSDMRALGSWVGAARLARQHLLPPAQYMREVYAPASTAPLPALYVRRAWRGARKWLVRS